MDYYSNFIEVVKLRNTTSYEVVSHCKSQFARHGIPDIVISDNGPQFSSGTFHQFALEYSFQHHTSSPYHPRSNGMAEKAVQTIKNLLKKATEDGKDFYLALLDLRNTPISEDSGSPVQRLMGRRTKTLLPTAQQLLIPKQIEPQVVKKTIQDQKVKQKFYYNRHAKQLPPLSVGDKVQTQTNGYWNPATETGVSTEPRSYFITTT